MDDDDEDDAPIRGEIRLAGYRRVSHGIAVKNRPGLTEEEEFLRDLHAYLLVLPESAVYTHLTAARLLGWQLPKLPEQVPVFVAVEEKDRRPRRHGLICSRLRRQTRVRRVDGLPVEQPEEILLRMARDLGLLDLKMMLDSARRMGHVDEKAMAAILASRRPGVRMLRDAWNLSASKCESAGESVLHLFHKVVEVPVEPGVDLHDDEGRFVGRADLLVVGTTAVHEYDGEHHRQAKQQAVDLRRARGLAGTPYVRRGFVLDDLLNHALVVMHELDRALDRPHVAGRIRRWRRLVEDSLYADAGRERVMNRWRRQNGFVSWSRTA